MKLGKLAGLTENSGFNTEAGYLNIISFEVTVENVNDIKITWELDSSSTITSAEYRFNGGSWNSVAVSSPATISDQDNGDYDVEMRFVNDNGIQAQTQVENVSVNDAIPTISTTDLDAVFRFENNILNKVDNTQGTEIGTITYQTGVDGNEGVFDGSSAIDTGSKTLGNGLFASSGNPFTVVLFTDVVITKSGTFVGRTINTPVEDKTFQLLCYNGTVQIILRGVKNDITDIIDGNQHQIAVRWDGTTAELWVDGAYHQDLSVGTASENSDETVLIGARTTDNPAYFLDGTQDQVSLWSRALTDQEVLDLYNYPALPDIPLTFSSFSGNAGDGLVTVNWALDGGKGSLASVTYTVTSASETVTGSFSSPDFQDSGQISGLTNGDSYDIEIVATDDENTVTSSIISVTPTAQTARNPEHGEWLNDVPTNILSDNYRTTLANSIEGLIPSSTDTKDVTNYGAVDGQESKSAFESAISALEEGGTLIIPAGTYYVKDLTITKKIYIQCSGTVKKTDYNVDGTNCSHMIKLEATCVWDGGTLDGNRASWGSHGYTGAHYTIRNTVPAIIKNVTSNNNMGRDIDNDYQYAGFRAEHETLYENVYCELSGRPFSCVEKDTPLYAESGGSITTFLGFYLYNCEAKNYTKKGFGFGGSYGYAICDNCTGHPIDHDTKTTDELFLFETDSNTSAGYQITDICHTAILKNCNISGWYRYQMMKSAQARWMIFDNCVLENYGLYGTLTSPARVYYAQTKENTTNQIGTRVIGMDSTFKCTNVNDGVNPTHGSAGELFPIVANDFDNRESVSGYSTPDRVTDGHFYNCTFDCRVNYSYRGDHSWKIWWSKDCTFIVREKTGEAFVWSDSYADGHVDYFVFEDCAFQDDDGSNTWIFEADGGFPSGTLHVTNPTGNYRSGVSPESYSNSMPTP